MSTTAPTGFHLPWQQIDEFLSKIADAAVGIEHFGPMGSALVGTFLPQLKPFFAESDELLPRVRMFQLMAQLERSAEGLDGDAQWNAMCDQAEAWARQNRPAFVDHDIPGTRS